MSKGWDVKQTVAGSEPFKVFDSKMNKIEKAIEDLKYFIEGCERKAVKEPYKKEIYEKLQMSTWNT